MKPILAVDLGTNAGAAVRDASGKIHSFLIRTQPTRFDSSALRFIKFKRAITELIDTFKIERVFFEKVYRHAGTTAAHVYAGYMTILTIVCEERGILCEGVSVQQIKKHATGKGNASKDLMVAAAKKKWPDQDIQTDDVADALHILDLGTTLT